MENFNQLIPIDEGKGKKRTMTSLQIAEITGKTHSNVMFKITKLGNNAERKDPYYLLTKKDCLLLASGYDANLRAKIINRWEELEENKRELSRKREKSLLSKI